MVACMVCLNKVKKLACLAWQKNKVPACPEINESTQDAHAINPNVAYETSI